ncbi:3-keto-disaccharide hydrolase [Terriglobus sp. ADX1]|uniref:3-keto-disaccharide hydrolase n=1 Tax=Terriglobus sp. ADX1 TaxID=2794063 RepID=UPI002FE5A863
MKYRNLIAAAGALTLSATLMAQAPAGAPPANPLRAGFQRIMQPPPMVDFNDNTGFTSLFDGTLKGWSYDSNLWDIKDGSIHLSATCEKPTGTVYAVSTAGEFGDFVLKYEMKGTGNINGGMQFRSYITGDPNSTGTKFPPVVRPTPPPRPAGANAPARPPRPAACANPGTPPTREYESKWDLAGPQADFDEGNKYSGMFYEQSGRAVIATPGYSMYGDVSGSYAMAKIVDKAQHDEWFHKDDWNQFIVVAIGHSTSIYMNGHLITQFVDIDPTYFRPSGKIGVESESTGDLWVRNISIKKL